MERDLPAFIAHRVRKLQTSRRLIEEIDVVPPEASRPKPGKLKANTIKCLPHPVQVSGKALQYDLYFKCYLKFIQVYFSLIINQASCCSLLPKGSQVWTYPRKQHAKNGSERA